MRIVIPGGSGQVGHILARHLSAPWMIEIGTFLMRTESELVLKSRRVVPTRLLEAGFDFEYPIWPGAAQDLVARWRQNSLRTRSS